MNSKRETVDLSETSEDQTSGLKQPPLLAPPSYLETTRTTEPLPMTRIDPDDLRPDDPRLGFQSSEPEVREECDDDSAPDGGWGWLIVLVAFFTNMVVDGIAYSCGVYFPIFLDEFHESASKTSWIGSLCSGCYLAISPIAGAVTNRYGCRTVSMIGCIWAAVSLGVASFAPSVDILILTLGISTGAAFGFLYLPSLVIVSLWFEKKRGVATGITTAGSGMGMFVVPPLCQLMIESWGWRNSMYGMCALVLSMAPLIFMYRPVPVKSGEKKTKKHPSDSQANPRLNESQAEDDCSSFSGSFVDDRTNEEPNKVPTIKETQYLGRGSSGNVGVAPSSAIFPRNQTSLLKQMMRNKNGGQMCQSMTAVNAEGLESRLKQCQGARTLEDLSGGCLKENDASQISHEKRQSSGLSVDKELRYRARPSGQESHLSVSVAEPLRKKDLFYSVSTVNLTLDNQNAANSQPENPMGERNGSVAAVGPSDDQEDEKLHRRLHKNKFVNGLLSMLGIEIFKDRCFILLLMSTIVCFLGFYSPFIYLMDFASSNDIDSNSAAFLISIIGIANTIGRPLWGLLVSSGVVDCVLLMNASFVIAGFLTIALPFMHSYWLIAFYSGAFGLAVASCICMKSLAIVQLIGMDKLTNALGYVFMFTGISSMFGVPLLGVFYDDGSKSYTLVFVMAGGLLVLGGLMGMPLKNIARWQRKKYPEKYTHETVVSFNPRRENPTISKTEIVISQAEDV